MARLGENDRRALDAAIEQAEKAHAEGDIPIGSVLMAPDGSIVARGHNERIRHDDSTAHAEMVCMRRGGRRRDWHTLTLASTLSPCAMCSGAAVLHRIPRVVVGERQTFQGREDWLRAEGIEVVVADDERCVKLMRRFIEARPEVWDEDIGVPE